MYRFLNHKCVRALSLAKSEDVGMICASPKITSSHWEFKQICWRSTQVDDIALILAELSLDAATLKEHTNLLSHERLRLRSSIVDLANTFVELLVQHCSASGITTEVPPFDVIFDAVQNSAAAVESGSEYLSQALAKLVMIWADTTTKYLSQQGEDAGKALLKV